MIHYRSGYKYQLVADYSVQTPILPPEQIITKFISLRPDGLLFIADGYAFDGPSGPAIDTRNAMRGSLIHDALYQLIRLGHLPDTVREQADQEYRRICLEDGMSRFRAWYQFRALRAFGAEAAKPHSEPEILTAP